jgi:hypothetical protein
LKDINPAILNVAELSAIPEDIVDAAIPLYVPGLDEPYAKYVCLEDWIDGFAEMHAKIHESTKFSVEEKAEKIAKFREVNNETTKTFDGNLTAKFLSKLAIHRKEIKHV